MEKTRSLKDMAKNTGSISYQDLYQFVDNRTRDINNSIQRVDEKVENLSSGRISVIEQNVANLQGRMMMIPTIISIAVNVFFFIVEYVLHPK